MCGGSAPQLVSHAPLILFLLLQRQKSTYTAHPKAEPTPLASSAPPAGSLYSSPVVSLFSQAGFLLSRDHQKGLVGSGLCCGVLRTPRMASPCQGDESLPYFLAHTKYSRPGLLGIHSSLVLYRGSMCLHLEAL